METQEFNNLGLIVAIGENREIGYKNNLCWRIKEDLAYFKNVTMDSYIIMGRNTYDSMPKNLPGRKYIVLSRNPEFNLEEEKIVYHNILDTLDFVAKEKASQFWVVGGGAIYEAFLPYVDLMHITQIEDKCLFADTFFPEFNPLEWKQTRGEDLKENDIKYHHMILQRKKVINK